MKSVSLIFLILITCEAIAQNVTIKGRDFMIGEDKFYPVVCNYYAGPVFRPNGSFYISPLNDYDNNNLEFIDLNTCEIQINRHFRQIKSMGFNSVRIMACSPFYGEISGNYKFIVKGYVGSAVINKPFNTDPYVQILFSTTKSILRQAALTDLKVILTPINGPIVSDENLYLSYIEDANDYFMALASYIVDNCTDEEKEALLAYDLKNEPLYSHMSFWSQNPFNNKKSICNVTAMWYDAIKSIDPHHLITLGGSSIADIYEWDLSVLHIDFYSAHVYPSLILQNNETILEGQKRFLGNINWLKDNCPMPYIIGETGFRAKPDDSGPDGTMEEQKEYAESTLGYVRNCNGSGYSWWDYGDYNWGMQSNGLLNWLTGDMYYGLLEKDCNCDPVPCTQCEKVVVDAFRNYDNSIINNCELPNNYYNPYNHPPTYEHTYNGSIKDETNNGITNAVITGVTKLGTYQIIGVDEKKKVHYYTHYTYSMQEQDFEGTFSIKPYNYVFPAFPDSLNLQDLKISAPGAMRIGFGWSSNPWQEIPHNGIYLLERKQFKFIDEKLNILVDFGDNKNIQAWNDLSVQNTNYLLGSSGEIKARTNVDVKSSTFYRGSEVLICNKSTFPECDKYMFNENDTNFKRNYYSELSKSIQISFEKKYECDIFPNPNHCNNLKFKIIDAKETKNYHIRIYDSFGRLLTEIVKSLQQFEIDISLLPAGVYFVEISSNHNKEIKKLIKL